MAVSIQIADVVLGGIMALVDGVEVKAHGLRVVLANATTAFAHDAEAGLRGCVPLISGFSPAARLSCGNTVRRGSTGQLRSLARLPCGTITWLESNPLSLLDCSGTVGQRRVGRLAVFAWRP